MTAPKRPLRAITVWQPYAGLLVKGIKLVENRTWEPPEGQLEPGELFAIHAGSKHDRGSWEHVIELRKRLSPHGRWKPQRETSWPLKPGRVSPDSDGVGATPYSAIIGLATLDEVRTTPRTLRDDAGEYEDPFWVGPFGWYLREPVPIEPVPCTGALGLWIVRGDLPYRVAENYEAALTRLGKGP